MSGVIAPRWFYATLALCAVVVTGAAAYHLVARVDVGRFLRAEVWVMSPGGRYRTYGALDTRTGRVIVDSGLTGYRPDWRQQLADSAGP